MPRKRSIKPGFNADRDIAALSPWARLLYIGLWGHMDRNGLIEDDPTLLRAQIFPRDEKNLSTEDVARLRDELLLAGPTGRPRLMRVIHMGITLLFCPTLSTHQKIYKDEPALFDVPCAVLDQIRRTLKKAQPIHGDSVPQPGTVPGPGTVHGLTPALSRASASASPSTSTSAQASPSASAPAGVDNSDDPVQISDPVREVIDGTIAKGNNATALKLIRSLPPAKREHYRSFIEQHGAGGNGAAVEGGFA